MLKKIYLYEIRGNLGDALYVVVDETSDTVSVCANDRNENMVHFDAEAYHLGVWGDQHGIRVSMRELLIDTDVLFQEKYRGKQIRLHTVES